MIVRNGQPFNIDAPWTDENGIQYPSNWYRLATDEERNEKGFSWADDPPSYDERYYYDANTPKPLEQVKQGVKSDLAAIRWNIQSQGIIWNDSVFATDDGSKVNYLAASLQAQANSAYTVVWKVKEVPDANSLMLSAESKFVTLNASDIFTLTNNGVDYITKCFEREQSLITAIDTATDLDSVLEIDIRSGWPTRNY